MKRLLLFLSLVTIFVSLSAQTGKLPYKKVIQAYRGDTLYTEFDGDSVRVVTNKKWAFWPALPTGTESDPIFANSIVSKLNGLKWYDNFNHSELRGISYNGENRIYLDSINDGKLIPTLWYDNANDYSSVKVGIDQSGMGYIQGQTPTRDYYPLQKDNFLTKGDADTMYLKSSAFSETDPIFNSSVAKNITVTDTTRWGAKSKTKVYAGPGLTQDDDSTVSLGGGLGTDDRYLSISSTGHLSIGDTQSYNTVFSSGSGTGNETFRVQAGSQSIIMNNTISSTGNGLIYGGDYSATYINRSLVDKAYVDNKVSSAAGGGVPSKLRNYSSGTDTAIVVSGIGTAAYGSFINNDGGYACLGTKNSTNFGIWSIASGYATAIKADVTDGTSFSASVAGTGTGLSIYAPSQGAYGLNIYGGRSIACHIGVLNTDGIGYKALAHDSVSITSSVRTAILGKNYYYTDFDAFGQQRLYNNSVLKYKLATDGSVTSTQFKLSELNTAPASATDAGVVGEIRITSTYIYVCTATNTWVRTALTTW